MVGFQTANLDDVVGFFAAGTADLDDIVGFMAGFAAGFWTADFETDFMVSLAAGFLTADFTDRVDVVGVGIFFPRVETTTLR